MNVSRAHLVDLSETKVVDQHCHIFPHASGAITKDFFMRLMSLESYNPDYVIQESTFGKYQNGSIEEKHSLDKEFGVGNVIAMSEKSAETTLFFKESVKELARFLQVPRSTSDVLKARNDRAMSNYDLYAKELFADARLQTLIVSDYPYLPYTEPSTFAGARLRHKLVLPSMIFDVIDGSASLSEAINQFQSSISECLGKRGFVGIKSMIAYGGARRGSGLDIGNPDEKDVAKEFSFYREKKGKVSGRQVKNLLDYFHRLAIIEATRFGRPFEFHTGIGDVDIVAEGCNPMLLVKMLQDEEIRRAKIILLHGGYPYVSEAGWITHFFPNVYLDSSIVFFTHSRAAIRRMEEMLEMAPYSKILYSSDGMMPELQWFSAKSAKRIMSAVLERLIGAGTLDVAEAIDLAESYFHANSETLYSL